MNGAIPPLPQYAFMAWSVKKKSTGTTLPLPLLNIMMMMMMMMMMMKSVWMRWEVHVTHMGEMRNTHKILVRKPEGKRPFQEL
jgi:hypothetical protein